MIPQGVDLITHYYDFTGADSGAESAPFAANYVNLDFRHNAEPFQILSINKKDSGMTYATLNCLSNDLY